MAQYGRSDEAVANGEISRGAPIGAGAAVKWDKKNRVDATNAHFSNTTVAGARANTDFNLFGNDTPSAFLTNMAVGVFGVSANAMANNKTQGAADRPAHAGWVVRRGGTGGIATAVPTAGGGGTLFANGETITLSNGTSNATLTVTTNSQGNIVSLAISNPGQGWINTTMVANAFVRQSHLANVQTTGTGLAYDNTSIVRVTNTNGLVVATTANLVTNITGGLTNTSFTTASVGLFPANQTNAGLAFTVVKYDGTTAVGNVSTTGFNARVVNSSGGAFTITLGGRAGRVHTETLVAMGSLGVANSTRYGPNSAVFVNSTSVNSAHYIDPA